MNDLFKTEKAALRALHLIEDEIAIVIYDREDNIYRLMSEETYVFYSEVFDLDFHYIADNA